MFHKTDFEDISYAVVTGKWVVRGKDKVRCYWPDVEQKKATKMCLKEVDIDKASFTPFVVTIKFESGMCLTICSTWVYTEI